MAVGYGEVAEPNGSHFFVALLLWRDRPKDRPISIVSLKKPFMIIRLYDFQIGQN